VRCEGFVRMWGDIGSLELLLVASGGLFGRWRTIIVGAREVPFLAWCCIALLGGKRMRWHCLARGLETSLCRSSLFGHLDRCHLSFSNASSPVWYRLLSGSRLPNGKQNEHDGDRSEVEASRLVS